MFVFKLSNYIKLSRKIINKNLLKNLQYQDNQSLNTTLLWSYCRFCANYYNPAYIRKYSNDAAEGYQSAPQLDSDKTPLVYDLLGSSRIVSDIDGPFSGDFASQEVYLDDIPQSTAKLKKCKSKSSKKSADPHSDKNENPPQLSKAKKNKSNESKLLLDEARWQGRNENFNHSLAAFLSVCMHNGHYSYAYETFQYYMKQSDKKVTKYTRKLMIGPYNEILKGLASQGDYDKVKYVVKCMNRALIQPDINTFAHILTSLGQMEQSQSNRQEIEATLDWMKLRQIELEEIFLSASFPGHSLNLCLEAIKRVTPNAEAKCFVYRDKIQFSRINFYDNSLLNKLNSTYFTNKVDSPVHGALSLQQLQDKMEKQIACEMKGHIEVPSIFKLKKTGNESNEFLYDDWVKKWRRDLCSALSAQKTFMAENFSKKSKGFDFYPYFTVLDNEEIISLLLTEIKKLSMGSSFYSPTLGSLSAELGAEFYNRFLIKYKEKTKTLDALNNIYHKYCQWYLNQSSCSHASYIPRVQWNQFVQENIKDSNLKDMPPEWPHTLRASIGKLLYNIIFTSVSIWKPGDSPDQAFPAFYKIHRTHDMRIRDEIKPSPVLLDVFSASGSSNLTFHTNSMPMVSPPVPWTSINSGGYFVCQSDFVRVMKYAQEQKTLMQNCPKASLYPVMDSLNQLASIPWKINKFVLDIIIEVFNKNGWEKMDVCPHPSSLPEPDSLPAGASKNEKRNHYKRMNEFQKKKNELNSLWHNMLYKLSIANWYRDELIWLPQNMDFRGRTYPIPPHLTHLSSDIFRAILNFAVGKPLGTDGLYWLKLHVINLTGAKKRSGVEDRLAFAEKCLDDILDSADNPLGGRQWWVKSEEPWQTLAACKELANALRSRNPEEYVSYLPVHQDGSCNGLQHYAALGRDKKGALSVNLSPAPVPQDVYSDVVDLVEMERTKDAENGLEIAKILEGVIKRKVIKQTIMTNVYGVTKYGARLQIMKQLNYLDDFPKGQVFSASTYLAAKTFYCLGSMFTATKEIQDWLSKLASGISKICLNNVDWMTPLDFPVVQPYSKSTNNPVIAGKVLPTFNNDGFLKPNNIKQRNAFPPNFIHSLDSTHMMLTSLYCQHAGFAFVSIHDCFWTHACSVPAMSKICRDQFIALHSQPILEDLARYLIDKYSDHSGYKVDFTQIAKNGSNSIVSLERLLKNVPSKGDFQLDDVSQSVFFFS